MADWELFAGSVFAVVAMITWAPWYGDIFRVNRLAAPRVYRLLLGVAPVACMLFLRLCLGRSAAKGVRESGLYTLVYSVLGAAALGVCAQLFSLLGVSARDDVLERRNRAGLVAIIGALFGATLCIAGGNIGEGPGMGAVVIASGAALIAWFILWCLVELLSGKVVSERITVERDLGSAVRLAGLLAGNGILLGAAAAGNWIPQKFLHDFVVSAWPVLLVTVAAIFAERIAKPRSSLGASVLTVSGVLVVVVAWVLRRGSGI